MSDIDLNALMQQAQQLQAQMQTMQQGLDARVVATSGGEHGQRGIPPVVGGIGAPHAPTTFHHTPFFTRSPPSSRHYIFLLY